jgi:hypothetical protein
VPAYYVALVENGTTQWRERAVAGAVKTPTPMLSVTATGVILNPWWEVPKSIEPEVRGRPGYVPVKGKDGKVQRWRQPPGPNNALGELKFVMPNQWAIYLHDTNARSRFNQNIRSLSHGCIRTQHITDLATKLLTDGGTEWTPEKVKETLASKKTVQPTSPSRCRYTSSTSARPPRPTGGSSTTTTSISATPRCSPRSTARRRGPPRSRPPRAELSRRAARAGSTDQHGSRIFVCRGGHSSSAAACSANHRALFCRFPHLQRGLSRSTMTMVQSLAGRPC